MDPRAGLGVVLKRKIPSPSRDSNPRAKIKLHIFSTLALDVGEWSESCPGRLTQGKEPLVLIVQEALWTPEPVWAWC
jgi:hypothetical protein